MNQLNLEALHALLETVGGDWDFVSELAEEFFANSPNLIHEINSGLETADANVVRRAAHSLKSTSASFGAMALSDMCKQVEAAARDGNLDGLTEIVAQIENEYKQSTELIKAEIARGMAA